MYPSVRELFAAFPAARDAVAFTEMFICRGTQDDPVSAWEVMMSARLAPAQVVDAIRFAADDPESVLKPADRARVVAQTSTADFGRYVAGRMGAV